MMDKQQPQPGMNQPGGSGNGNGNGHHPAHSAVTGEVAFGYPRDFLGNQFVYVVISPRARGLSIGININPLVKCTFQCVYCEVDRMKPARAARFDVDRMADELTETLELAQRGGLRKLPRYAHLPQDLLQLRHVALSGDGEPTLSEDFWGVMRTINSIRGMSAVPAFKLVLVTNSTALDTQNVQTSLKLLRPEDEIWAKLDGGTQGYLNRVSGSSIPLEKILKNILMTGRRRPVVIQSLFPAINGAEPDGEEIRQYALRLKELNDEGAQIPLVQIYSATRPMARTGCGHLPLPTLSRIAKAVREVAGLKAEVF
jgi:wyosine [tRNA(Phe)-imidazoG37] synthetase (radical SAM superfamily)